MATPWGAIGSIGGAVLGGLFGKKSSDKQSRFQKEFAQHGLRWKVEDAKAAGLHPLAAIGAQGAQYNPVIPSQPDYSQAFGIAGKSYEARKLNEAQLQKVQSETDYVKEMAAASRQSRALQLANHSALRALDRHPPDIPGQTGVVATPVPTEAMSPIRS